MKLNNLSRLTALLLAIVLFLSSIVYAETVEDYEALTDEYYADCTAEQNVELCAFLAELAKMEPSERYGCMLEAFLASNDGATWATAIQLHHYFGHYVKNEYTDLLCMCNVYNADFTDYWLNMYPYGDANHVEGCPWYQSGTSEYNEAVIHAQEFLLLETDQEKTDFVADDKLTDTQLYDMLDVLGWRANTTLTSAESDVAVKGALPNGTQLTATALAANDALTEFIWSNGTDEETADEILNSGDYALASKGYDLKLDFYGRKIEPKTELQITYYDVRDPYAAVDHVDVWVLHVLESKEAIEAEKADDRTVYETSNEAVLATATEAARSIEPGKVFYTLVGDETSEDVIIGADGSLTFEVSSLSEIESRAGMNMVDSAENFLSKHTDAYFYWRLEDETDHSDESDCTHIKTVTYTNSTDTTVTGTVPHEDYAGRPSTLLCSTVVGYDTEKKTFLDGSTSTSYTDASGAFTVYVETEPGWVITSYRIGCEGSGQQGENCNTVEAQNLTVVPDESGNYISKITIPCSAKSFGHSSDYDHYVLLLTIEQVSINISVEKSVEPKYVTWDEDNPQTLTYTITATNNSTNNIQYKKVQFEDSFFLKGATITGVSASDGTTLEAIAHLDYKYSNGGQSTTAEDDISLDVNGGNDPLPTEKTITSSSGSWPSQSSSTKTADVVAAYISVTSKDSNAFWEVGETITLTYTYTLTEADAEAGILPNTVFVTAFYDPNDDSTTAEDFNTAYVEVLISDSGFGSMQVHKKFEGLSAAQVSQLIGGNFAISVTPGGEGEDVASPTIGAVTKVSDTEYYWNVTGLVEGATYTVKETGYTHPDFAAPTSTIKIDCYASDATTATVVPAGTTYTDSVGKTNAIVAADVYQVYLTNTYSSGDLTITKQAVTNDEATLSTETLADMQFPFIVTFTGTTDGDEDGVNDALGYAYDYSVVGDITSTDESGNVTTTRGVVSTGKISSGGVIWLAPGQTVTIEGLPAGAVYKVTEANVTGDGTYEGEVTSEMTYYVDASTTYEFTVTSSGTTGTISTGTTQAAVITNTYGQSTGSLTITKAVDGATANEEDTFIFTIAGTGVNMQVVLKAEQSVTINDLPAGDYTVTEDTSWSWRYTLSGVTAGTETTIALVTDGAKVAVPAGGNGAVTFTNKVTNNQWLDGSAYADNAFTDSGVTRVD